MILLTKEYDPELIKLGDYNEKNVTFFYPIGSDEFTKLRIQTPIMSIPFEPDEKKNKDGETFVKNISFSMNGKEKVKMFKEKMEKTDEKIKSLLPEALKVKTFSPTLWKSKNEKYEPTMKVAIPYRDGVCKSSFFDNNNQKITESEVQKGIRGSAILKLDNMWIWKDKVGINWTVEQFKVQGENTIKFRTEN